MTNGSLVGTLVAGRFRIAELLGEGAMGEVYCAQHEVLNRKYAIKVLKTDVEAEPILVERFRREARAASRFDHPNIVYIADFGQMDNGRLYLAMEYSEGESLQDEMDALHPDRFPMSRSLVILRQVTDAIGAAHQAQVVHRDLKPDNILLTRDGAQRDRVKILDFGLAKILGDSEEMGLTRKGEIFGTPAFLSPEQARGDTIDHRADIYALGVLMYELFCGRLPFEHRNITRMLIAQQEETPRPPSSFLQSTDKPIPPALEELVMRCLAKQPAERPQSMEELNERIVEQIEASHQIGYRSTVRFTDLASLDLQQDPEDEQSTIPIDSSYLAGSYPQEDETVPLEISPEDDWDDDQTSAQVDSMPQSLASLEIPSSSEQPAGADDEKKWWHWQQACKKARTVASILLREQPGQSDLTVAIERHSRSEAEVVSLETEMALLKDRYDEEERTYREQESGLRYALVDLSIERGRLLDHSQPPPGPLQDLDFQIGQLETRISATYQEKEHRLGQLEQQTTDRMQRLDQLQQILTDREVELVRQVRSLRQTTRSPQAERLYDSINANLRWAR